MPDVFRRRQWIVRLVRASMVCCALLIVACVQSFFVSETWSLHIGGGSVGFQIVRGRFLYVNLDVTHSNDWSWPNNRISLDRPDIRIWPEWNVRRWDDETALGFGFVYFPDEYTVAVVPLWAMILATALPPLRWLTHPLRDRRQLFGHCTGCGYDLR